MDVLVISMETITKTLPSLTLQYYVWKRSDIIPNLFIDILMLTKTNSYSAIVSTYYVSHC